MGKLFNVILIGVIITFTLLLLNGSGQNVTSIVSFILSPGSAANDATILNYEFLALIFGVATVTGFISIGLAALVKQDWVARGGIVLSLSTIIIAPIVDLWNFIHSQTNALGLAEGYTCSTSPLCDIIATGGMGQIIAALIAGPLLLYVVWSCVEWVWRGDS